MGLSQYVCNLSSVVKSKSCLLLPIPRYETVIRFTRQLTKKITNTGHDSYVLSIPREIADELKLPYGGLVSLRIWAHRNEVLIENYEESWHPYQEVFSPAKLGFVDVEIEPKTRGRSRGFAEGRVLDPRQFLREAKALCRYLEATRLPSGLRRRRRRRH